ncbi:MAG TPA: HEAT repeat domain-containing protein, partial [Pirellulales bacterium]|nr:HEAT repeat domain-containing protein [Pirellulales bacterium]
MNLVFRLATRSLLAALLAAVATAAEPPESLELERALRTGTPGEANIADEARPTVQQPQLPWTGDLDEGLRQSVAAARPLLVRFESQSCPWCKKLEQELVAAEVQSELSEWILVLIDVEKSPADARRLSVGPIPALRVLSRQGAIVASHDGYLPAPELTAWLVAAREKLTTLPDDALAGDGEPSALDVARLARTLGTADPAIREAAIRRLAPYPVVSLPAVVRTIREEKLGARLAALELLTQWQAPVEGLDPWQPDTLAPDRLASLEAWATKAELGKIAAGGPPSAAELAAARDEIARLIAASESDARAIRERLARFGPRLLEEVRRQAAHADTDLARNRLTALRYRLVATSGRVLNWPGGIERLASPDPQQRHRAADELAAQAGLDDQPLLLELFSDTDPLVRELSLRALKAVAANPGAANHALAQLLDDPEPNVRAAVLKQLAESPPQSMIPQLRAYVLKERDPDLVVHGIRALRAAKDRSAIESLIKLLADAHWQVRAEAAESLGKLIENRGNPAPAAETADAYAALVERLSDSDSFVASRATDAIKGIDLVDAVPPLVKLAQRHPDIAPSVIETLIAQPAMRRKAIPALRKFVVHRDAAVRAAAIGGLCEAVANAQPELLAALADADSRVRAAAAKALFKRLDEPRQEAFGIFANRVPPTYGSGESTDSHVHVEVSSPLTVIANGLSYLLGSKARTKKAEPAEATEQGAKPAQPGADTTKPTQPAATDAPAPVKVDDKAADEAPDEWSAWILESREGKHRPKWTNQLAAPLQKMLKAEDQDERLAAAMALVAMGRTPAALPTVLAAARQPHPKADTIADVFCWLLWPERESVFDALVEHDALAGHEYGLLDKFTEIPDPRAGAGLWALLAEPRVSTSRASAVYNALEQSYFGARHYDESSITPAAKKQVVSDAERRLDPQLHWQTV